MHKLTSDTTNQINTGDWIINHHHPPSVLDALDRGDSGEGTVCNPCRSSPEAGAGEFKRPFSGELFTGVLLLGPRETAPEEDADALDRMESVPSSGMVGTVFTACGV